MREPSATPSGRQADDRRFRLAVDPRPTVTNIGVSGSFTLGQSEVEFVLHVPSHGRALTADERQAADALLTWMRGPMP